MKEIPQHYPLEILPSPFYKKRFSVEKLLRKYDALMVVRLVMGIKDDYMLRTEAGNEILSDKVFSNVANLSLNLAGGKFDTSVNGHLRFLPKNDYGKNIWNGGSVNIKEFKSRDSYEEYNPCFGLCFYACDIHKKTFPFFNFFETKKARDEYQKSVLASTAKWDGSNDARIVGAFESKKNNVSVYARLELNHAPTNGNYWHVTLDTYRPSETDYVHSDGKRQSADKRMFKALKQDLIQKCFFEKEVDYNISQCYYMRFPYWLLCKCYF